MPSNTIQWDESDEENIQDENNKIIKVEIQDVNNRSSQNNDMERKYFDLKINQIQNYVKNREKQKKFYDCFNNTRDYIYLDSSQIIMDKDIKNLLNFKKLHNEIDPKILHFEIDIYKTLKNDILKKKLWELLDEKKLYTKTGLENQKPRG